MKKLTRIDKQKIREAFKDGITQQELALLFDVNQGQISKVVKGGSKQSQLADRMERFLGGATANDGCYENVMDGNYYKTPEAFIDRNDPLSILEAEEEIENY